MATNVKEMTGGIVDGVKADPAKAALIGAAGLGTVGVAATIPGAVDSYNNVIPDKLDPLVQKYGDLRADFGSDNGSQIHQVHLQINDQLKNMGISDQDIARMGEELNKYGTGRAISAGAPGYPESNDANNIDIHKAHLTFNQDVANHLEPAHTFAQAAVESASHGPAVFALIGSAIAAGVAIVTKMIRGGSHTRS